MLATQLLAVKQLNTLKERKKHMITYDSFTLDSTGAFLNGELEILDQRLHLPLYSVTWHRDIQVRTDIDITTDLSSFTNSTYGSNGGATGGKSWIGRNSSAISGVSLDIQKTAQNLPIWGKSVEWTVIELETAMKLGRPVDTQKVEALSVMWNMDVDAQVYIGDADLGVFGLVNSPAVTNSTNAVNGTWATATPVEILEDIRELEQSVWKASAYAAAPRKLLVDPVSFAYLLQPLAIGGVNYNSIREYIARNSVCLSVNGVELDIQPAKWLAKDEAGQSITGNSANIMIAYSNDYDKVRIPLTPLLHTPITYRSIYQETTYYGRLGAPEIVYASTIGRRSGI